MVKCYWFGRVTLIVIWVEIGGEFGFDVDFPLTRAINFWFQFCFGIMDFVRHLLCVLYAEPMLILLCTYTMSHLARLT